MGARGPHRGWRPPIGAVRSPTTRVGISEAGVGAGLASIRRGWGGIAAYGPRLLHNCATSGSAEVQPHAVQPNSAPDDVEPLAVQRLRPAAATAWALRRPTGPSDQKEAASGPRLARGCRASVPSLVSVPAATPNSGRRNVQLPAATPFATSPPAAPSAPSVTPTRVQEQRMGLNSPRASAGRPPRGQLPAVTGGCSGRNWRSYSDR